MKRILMAALCLSLIHIFNIGRAVGGFSPMVVGMIISMYSYQVAIAFLAIIYVIDILATVFLIDVYKRQVN